MSVVTQGGKVGMQDAGCRCLRKARVLSTSKENLITRNGSEHYKREGSGPFKVPVLPKTKTWGLF